MLLFYYLDLQRQIKTKDKTRLKAYNVLKAVLHVLSDTILKETFDFLLNDLLLLKMPTFTTINRTLQTETEVVSGFQFCFILKKDDHDTFNFQRNCSILV